MKTLPMLLAIILLAGCAHRNPYSGPFKIDAPRDKQELYGAYHDAVNRLGQTHKGGTVKVRFLPGKYPSNAPGWLGRPIAHFDGIALGYYNLASRNITIYTTNGRWRYETARWEFGRAILHSRGLKDWNEQARIMERKGFR